MPLINYVKTTTNNWLLIFESHGDSNRCTPYRGKTDAHDTYASRTNLRTSYIRFLRAAHIRGNLSQGIINVGRTLLLMRKRAPDTTPSPTEWSTGLPPSFSPNTVIEVIMKANNLLMNKLEWFTGSITPVCDRYVQYLVTGANPSVVNRHRRGLQSWRCRLATTHSSTFLTNSPPHYT
jgi:hypothetical protein